MSATLARLGVRLHNIVTRLGVRFHNIVTHLGLLFSTLLRLGQGTQRWTPLFGQFGGRVKVVSAVQVKPPVAVAPPRGIAPKAVRP